MTGPATATLPAQAIPLGDVLDAATKRLGTVTREPRREAEHLAMHALRRGRASLFAHADESVPPEACARLDTLLKRRAAGEPLAYVLGWQAFHGIDLQVDARALIPRPETELLVEWIVRTVPAGGRLLDLGTGTGAIALAAAAARRDVAVTAVDADPKALALARENRARLGLDARVRLMVSDWGGALGPDEAHTFDVVVSNPPYVEEDAVTLDEELRWEPRDALAAGAEGLDAVRALLPDAARLLRPDGLLAVEHSPWQGNAVAKLAARHGCSSTHCLEDLERRPRITVARRHRDQEGP